jgi:hypothetical protein
MELPLPYRYRNRKDAHRKQRYRPYVDLETNFFNEAKFHADRYPGNATLEPGNFGGTMFFSINIWLLPAIAAGASSYLVCLIWERYRNKSAPNGMLAGFLFGLSFIMGGISSYWRYRVYTTSLENNIIVMFTVGASTTFLWLLMRRYLPNMNGR